MYTLKNIIFKLLIWYSNKKDEPAQTGSSFLIIQK